MLVELFFYLHPGNYYVKSGCFQQAIYHCLMRRRQLAGSKSELSASVAQAISNCCALCEREVQQLSRHHLIPREEGGRHGPTADLCQPCHSSVHLLLDNKELARHYDTIEALRNAEKLQKYLHWIRRSRVERISNRRGNK